MRLIKIVSHQHPCRDDECSYTVQHMFDQADVPERVFAGVCEQNWRGDRESCRTGHLPISLRNNVQYTLINASEAKGPTYGRALAQQMFRGEDYYVQASDRGYPVPVGCCGAPMVEWTLSSASMLVEPENEIFEG